MCSVLFLQRPPLFRYRFTDLLFDNCYNMGVQSIHRNPYLLQSELKWTRLVTPTCLEMHAGNMSICGEFFCYVLLFFFSYRLLEI